MSATASLRPAKLQRWHARVASVPSAATAWGLAGLLALSALADGPWLHAATGIGRSTYDAMVHVRLCAAPPDPRDTLATGFTPIETQQPAAIVWDISFADASTPLSAVMPGEKACPP